jgi:hypothetical protein
MNGDQVMEGQSKLTGGRAEYKGNSSKIQL